MLRGNVGALCPKCSRSGLLHTVGASSGYRPAPWDSARGVWICISAGEELVAGGSRYLLLGAASGMYIVQSFSRLVLPRQSLAFCMLRLMYLDLRSTSSEGV